MVSEKDGSVANFADWPAWLKVPATVPMGQQVMIEFGFVANFLGGRATPMDMTGFIPPTNRIAVLGTLRLSSATGPSESCA
jgi:hypothetical protein